MSDGASITISADDAREAVRLLLEGFWMLESCGPAQADEPLLQAAATRATRLMFRIVAACAEGERAAEPSEWRREIAALVGPDDAPAHGTGSRQQRPVVPPVLKSGRVSHGRVTALLARTPLADVLAPRQGRIALVDKGSPEIDLPRLLLAVDRISRASGPIGGRYWTDFRRIGPRDFGRLYESVAPLRPAFGREGVGGAGVVRWAPDSARRKCTGSYYTPEPIVLHIVGMALEPVLAASADSMPDAPMALQPGPALGPANAGSRPNGFPYCRPLPRILDPAMGCGYFLLAAAELLYARLQQGGEDTEGLRRLRRRITAACLYGVDKDPTATDLAKLAVASWAEGRIVSHWEPAVADHLRWGDALTGPGPGIDAADVDPNTRVFGSAPPFAWETAFREVFADRPGGSGFDAVVGNPPYDNSRGGLAAADDLAAVARHARRSPEYRIRGAVDLYRLFLQRSLRLCRPGAVLSMIVPGTLLGDRDAAVERTMLLRDAAVIAIDDFPYDDARRRVFPGASLATCIVTCRRGGPSEHFTIRRWSDAPLTGEPRCRQVDPRALDRYWPGYTPFVGLNEAEWAALDRLHAAAWLCPLSEIARSGIGEANSGYHKRFMVDHDTGSLLVRGADVSPYHIQTAGRHKRWIDREGYQAALSVAARSSLAWRERRVVKQAVKNMRLPKRLVAALSEPGWFLADSTDFFVARPPYDPRYILALLNSRTVPEWLFRMVSSNNNVNLYQVRDVPVPRVRFDTPPAERMRAAQHGWELLAGALDARLRTASTGDQSPGTAHVCWETWLGSWLHGARQDGATPARETGVADVIHDVLVHLVQKRIDLAYRQREPTAVLEAGSELSRRAALVDRAIDSLVWAMYKLGPAEIAAIQRGMADATPK